ncbi:hypothetical protein AX14_012103 [Amanita brunnescens Koide BX004]|nr:hypothetical protein AX14_012103 [Amanita brunnescens Koide BX004]
MFVNSEYVRSEGSVKVYSFVNPAGNTVSRWFCSGCGSQLCCQSSARPDGMSVRAGNFEELTKWPIYLEIFTKDRWPGLSPIPGAVQTKDGNVNVAELMKSLTRASETESKPVAAEQHQ